MLPGFGFELEWIDRVELKSVSRSVDFDRIMRMQYSVARIDITNYYNATRCNEPSQLTKIGNA